jgi:hypothetical protein
LKTNAETGASDFGGRETSAPETGFVPTRGPLSEAAGARSTAASRRLRIPIALVAEASITGKTFRSRNALWSPRTTCSCGRSPVSKYASINASSLSATISTSLPWYSLAMSRSSAGTSPTVTWPEASLAYRCDFIVMRSTTPSKPDSLRSGSG